MESLWENKALLYALSATGSFILILALGWLPELDEQFGIIEFPPEVWPTNIKQIRLHEVLIIFYEHFSLYSLFPRLQKSRLK